MFISVFSKPSNKRSIKRSGMSEIKKSLADEIYKNRKNSLKIVLNSRVFVYSVP